MNDAPILVLQMQRMGDLVLSFPLLARLAAIFPGHPLWVVGERAFYEPLLKLSPRAAYFSYEAAPGLKKNAYRLVVNISHRPEAARLAGSLKAEEKLGPLMDKQGRLFIRGNWQIYRASLTDNNRYNLFHWADLNCLDLVRPDLMLRTVWTEARPGLANGARLGLFLGASQPEKHPDARFWVALARRLLAMGLRPVLLGGKAEAGLAATVADALKAPALNLCGRFSVGELAAFLGRLDLLVTPDTGPMHVAAWIGTPCLNLSLGPVNAWETGPCAPGHLVLRAALDCVGCWRCAETKQFCRQAMSARATAAIIAVLQSPALEKNNPGSADPAGSQTRKSDEKQSGAGRKLELFRTRRDRLGLFDLARLSLPARTGSQPGPDPDQGLNPVQTREPGRELEQGRELEPRPALARFWQGWFAASLGYADRQTLLKAAAALAGDHPDAAARLAAAAAAFALSLARDARSGRLGLAEDPEAWRAFDPIFRPFSGYAQMYAQNENGSPAARKNLLNLAEDLAALFVG